MHYSRISAFLLGGLLIGSLFMGFVATGNFQTVSEILKSPPPQAEKMIKALGDENARLLLRYQAGEENRLFFQTWETAQLVLGLLLAALLFLMGNRRLLANSRMVQHIEVRAGVRIYLLEALRGKLLVDAVDNALIP